MSTHLTVSTPLNEPPNEPPNEQPPKLPRKARWIFYAFMLVFLLLLASAVKFTISKLTAVTSTQSIGRLIHVTPSGALSNQSTVETDSGFYPLESNVFADKGIALILVEEVWGDHYVCDIPKSMCAATSRVGFELPKPRAKP